MSEIFQHKENQFRTQEKQNMIIFSSNVVCVQGYGSCSGSGTNSYGGSGGSGGSSGGSQSSDHTTVTSPHLAVLLSLSLAALILCALTEDFTSLIS